MEPIDISSDSDVEITDGGESLALSPERTSTKSRILPSWASTAATSSRNAGYSLKSQNICFPNKGYASNGNSLVVYDNSSKKLQSQPGSSYSIGGLNQLNFPADDLYLSSDGNLGEPRQVNPWIANVSGTDYEKLSSLQAFKRTLPASIQPSAYGTRSYFPDGASSSQTNNVYGSMYHSVGPGLSNSRAYAGEHYNRSNDDAIIIYDKSGSRILPPSLISGKSVSSGSSAITNDSVPRSLGGDERAAGNDERIIFQAALQDFYQPKVEADVPDGLLSVPLLKHQKIALAWMLQRETRSLHCLGGILADDQGLGKTISMIALIQVQKSLDSSSKSEDNNKKTEALNLDEDEDKKPEALNLDEDDDNGGTALDKLNQAGECGDTEHDKQVSTSKRMFSRRRPSAGTLVVCPASVLRQWARELDDKAAAEAKLSVLVYHGGSRTKDPVELAKYDVVLTTYAIVNNEVPKQPVVDEDDLEGNVGENGLSLEFSFSKKRKKIKIASKKRKKGKKGIDAYALDCDSGTLARVGWSRVILDEAQTIKNHRTQVARACCSLRAKRRWCLSGTPIQNTIDDLYSYFRFLRYEPYNVYKSFYNTIKVPISRDSMTGYKKLQVVLRGILLRRTKGTLINGEPIIILPPKSTSMEKVDFSMKERAFYTQLEADSRSKFKAYAAAGTVKLNYANILLMLLRLRQACNHPVLVNGLSSDSGGKISAEMAKKIPKDRIVDLLNRLAASSAICCVCNDPPEDPVVTMCGHVFCYQCVSEQFTGDDNECPAPDCKEQLGPNVVFSEATLRSCVALDDLDASRTPYELDEPSMVWQRDYSSSKIKALLDILTFDCVENGPNSKLNDHAQSNRACRAFSNYPTEGPMKSIIFSQWTGMLDLVGDALKEFYIEFRRLDGTMSLAARDKAVKDFNADPEVSVMLMSLKAGNLGLNMVAACHVILLDPWWNPTTEDQAVDRAHRIGQTRPVTVTRLTVKDTVEDRILALQEEKRKMVASAFGEDQSGGSATRLTLQDLRYLFNLND